MGNNPVNFNDPTGHEPFSDFIAGFGVEFVRTNMWFSPYHQEVGAIHKNESDAMLAGRLVADVASAVIGAAEVGMGAGGEGGGILACATGVGCPAGAATMALSGALILQGAGTGVRAAEGAGHILALFSNRNDRPANEVLPATLKRKFPSQHLDMSLDEIKDALRTATGKEKATLQMAKKLLEQVDRLMGKLGRK